MTPIVMVKRPGAMEAEVEEFVRGTGEPVVIYEAAREALHPQPEKNRCLNIARGRTEAFRRALAGYPAAEWFFSLDADVVPPKGAIPILLSGALTKGFKAIGGWFPAQRGCWAGGRAMGKTVSFRHFQHFTEVRPGVTETDLLSLGCTLVHRSLVEGHVFDAGIDRFIRNGNREWCHLADSGAFSEYCQKRGVKLWLEGTVVARHLGVITEPVETTGEPMKKILDATECIRKEGKMKFTNLEIENAANALNAFNPACGLKVKLRLSRNLRQLVQKVQDKEHDRQRLFCSAVKDKTRLQQNGQMALNAEELEQFHREYRKLQQESVEVELHPVFLYDSTETTQKSKVPAHMMEFGLDVSVVKLPAELLTPLMDVVLQEAELVSE